MSDEQAPPVQPLLDHTRKYRRKAFTLNTGGVFGIGTLGSFAWLKAEADNFRRAGAQFLTEDPTRFTPLFHNYLSGVGARPHDDQDGSQYKGNNDLLYASIGKPSGWLVTGTAFVWLHKEMILNVYMNILDHLKLGSCADDGVQKIYLDTPGGTPAAKKPTVFHELVEHVNMPVAEFSKLEHDRCIFYMSMAKFHSVAGNVSKNMSNRVMSKISNMYEENVSCKAVHMLFHWNAHSFLKYHQITDGDVVAFVNLSPSTATMHIAGRSEATFEGIGSMHIFPAKAFHRSGTAQRRCVMVAFVVTLEGTLYADDMGDEDNEKVKPEVKPKVKPEVQPEENESDREDGEEGEEGEENEEGEKNEEDMETEENEDDKPEVKIPGLNPGPVCTGGRSISRAPVSIWNWPVPVTGQGQESKNEEEKVEEKVEELVEKTNEKKEEKAKEKKKKE